MKEVFERVKYELNAKKFVPLILSKDFIKELLETVSNIENEIRKAIEGQKIEKDERIYKSIEKFRDIFRERIVREPLSSNLAKFIRDVLTIFYNYLSAINDQKMKDEMLILVRLLDGFLTLNETIAISRELIDYLRRIMYYSPPYVELSKHYLETLLKECERQ